jgi:serine/threonine protein phosphatase PrpC
MIFKEHSMPQKIEAPQIETISSLDVYGATDRGKQRDRNEDQFLVADLTRGMLLQQTSLPLADQTQLSGKKLGKLLLVADGIGGHQDGDAASRIAVEAITLFTLNSMRWFYALDSGQGPELERELATAMRRAEEALESAGAAQGSSRHMGTTMTIAYLLWPRLYLVHAGDSRAYLLRQRKLRQLTRDHTTGQVLVDRGVIDEDKVDESPFANVLDNALLADVDRKLRLDVTRYELARGDTLLLCTDGVSSMLDDAKLRLLLSRGGPAEETCCELLREANRAGGKDNATAIIAHAR